MSISVSRLKEIFLAALEKAPQDRAAFVDQACGGDLELRQKVNDLLIAHHSPDDLLEGLVPSGPTEVEKPGRDLPQEMPVTVNPVIFDLTGSVIAGRYKLLEKLGEGGMGTVYVADQTGPIRRRVALKLIKLGMDSAQVLARFEAERQALALMENENIAKVFDGGVSEHGRPFFVMEYVKGVKLTDYCDQNRLTIQQRLELFLPVCRAVQHAHQKGVIHRDLKPSNILVGLYDGKAVPKVIDFGLAKAINHPLTERTVYTAHGITIGTLQYMSPEQAEFNNLDIDTRTDIYSLGVILYELLTGTTPIDKQQIKLGVWNEIIRMIREEEPPKPSLKLSSIQTLPNVAALRSSEPVKLSKLMRGDLDWIVMKALNKERNRRYETANAFRLDVERFLADEPVSAGPPSATYRMWKFLRRHRGKVLVATVGLLLLMGGIIGTTWGMLQAVRSQREAESEASVALAVQHFLENDVLQQVDPFVQANQGFFPDKDIKLRELLDRAAKNISKGGLEKQPLVLASLELTIGKAYLALGEHVKARPHIERSIELRKRLLGAKHPKCLESRMELGRFHYSNTNYDEAEQAARSVMDDASTTGPVDQVFLGHCKMLYALILENRSRFIEAKDLYEQCYDQRKKDLTERNYLTLQSLRGVANCYRLLTDYQKAEELFLRTIQLQRESLGADHPDTLSTVYALVLMYSKLQDYAKVEKYLDELIPTASRIFAEDHPWLLNMFHVQAVNFQDAGKLPERIMVLQKLYDLYVKKYGPDNEYSLATLNSLAACFYLSKDYNQAEECYKKLLPVVEKLFGPEDTRTLIVMRSLAGICEKTGRYAAADVYWEKVLECVRRKPDKIALLVELVNVASNKLSLGKLEEVKKLLDEAAKLDDHSSNVKSHLRLALCRLHGALALKEGRLNQARSEMVKACLVLKQDDAQQPARKSSFSFVEEERALIKELLREYLKKQGKPDKELEQLLSEI